MTWKVVLSYLSLSYLYGLIPLKEIGLGCYIKASWLIFYIFQKLGH